MPDLLTYATWEDLPEGAERQRQVVHRIDRVGGAFAKLEVVRVHDLAQAGLGLGELESFPSRFATSSSVLPGSCNGP